jgi:nitroreductase
MTLDGNRPPAGEAAGEPEAATAVLRRVRAVRDFTDADVTDAALDEILSVARWTGSAENRQPWRFVVMRTRETLQALAELAPNAAHIGRAPVAVAIVMPGERAVLDAFDEGRVTERILVAATALGLASGMGWVPQEARADACRLLGVPEERLLRTVIAIGHAAPTAARPRSRPGTARRPLDELVHRERWDAR